MPFIITFPICLDYLLSELVKLELSAGFLAVSSILGNNALLDGLVKTGNKFLELLLGDFLVACIDSLEELLVRIMKLSLGDGIALIRLGVLTITFSGGAAALDICHFIYPFSGNVRRIVYQKRTPTVNYGQRTPLSHFFWGDLSQFSKKPNKTL